MNLSQINAEMSTLDDWSLQENSINKNFSFQNFKSALEFVNKIGDVAEKNNHHPLILLNYNIVELSLTTHSTHSLTQIDFTVAKDIDDIE